MSPPPTLALSLSKGCFSFFLSQFKQEERTALRQAQVERWGGGLAVLLASLATVQPVSAQISAPQPLPIVETIPAARDIPYPGMMMLNVDASDTSQNIFRISQSIPVAQAGPVTLLFPKWLPGAHAPRGEIEKLAGLVIKAGGRTLEWKRDAVDVYAFHINVPQGARTLDLNFKFLSATESDQGRIVMTPEMMNLQFVSLSLYPAGYYTRQIPVSASVTYPAGWQAATALRPASVKGNSVTYHTVSYEVLADSPVFAGKHFRAEPLGSNVTLNIVADDARNLVIKPAQLDAHKRLVDQSLKLFGTRQFDRYDFLLALTDRMGSIGLEHHRSSENGVNPGYFTDWDAGPGRRNLLPHEFTHSWNGKHRRPADLFTPDFRTPMRDSLLWVYEGQTQFWGYVLGARSGLFSKQETLDALANIAANLDSRRARDWRALEDTTNDPIITARRPKGWTSYQRSEDYYNEGMLIWLEADNIIRTQSGGVKGMDDFARTFFGTKEGDYGQKPYDFDEIVRTLSGLVSYDWASFLRQRLSEKAANAPLAGFTNAGYRLIFTDEPTPFFKDAEKTSKDMNLTYSIGATLSKTGKITSIVWDGPLFNAGLSVGTDIIAVNGHVYAEDEMKEAIRAAKGTTDPIKLIIKSGDRIREVNVQWNGGLRYPRLEKIGAGESSLDRLLAPRQ
jgi:predicted metalloprotease with PDZ domain